MNVPGRQPWVCTEAAFSSWAESLLQNQPGKLLSRWGAAPKAQLHPLYYMSAQLSDSLPILQFLSSTYFCTILERPFFPMAHPVHGIAKSFPQTRALSQQLSGGTWWSAACSRRIWSELCAKLLSATLRPGHGTRSQPRCCVCDSQVHQGTHSRGGADLSLQSSTQPGFTAQRLTTPRATSAAAALPSTPFVQCWHRAMVNKLWASPSSGRKIFGQSVPHSSFSIPWPSSREAGGKELAVPPALSRQGESTFFFLSTCQ